MRKNFHFKGNSFIRTINRLIVAGMVLLLTVGCREMRGKKKNPLADGCEALVCHPTSPIGEYPPSSGKHDVHLGYLERTGNSSPCDVCHTDYMNNENHKNGFFDKDLETEIVYFDADRASADWDNPGDDCNNITCHGNNSADWYEGGTGCQVCHISGTGIDPVTTGGTSTDGKHIPHVETRGFDCETCHKDYKEKPTHIDGTYGRNETGDITGFYGTFNNVSVSVQFDNESNACGVISCHGDTGGVKWYGEETGCKVCHRTDSHIDPLKTGGTGVNGKHAFHVTGKNVECENCHSGYKGKSTHMNGTYGGNNSTGESGDIVAFSGSFSGSEVSVAFVNDDRGTCNTISCHGGTGNVDWYVDSSGCTACHASGSPIAPGSSGTSGKHETHVNDKGIDCVVCHGDYTSTPNHMNGSFGSTDITDSDISGNGEWPASGNDVSFTYLDGTGTNGLGQCADISCHGTSAQADWGDATEGDCTICHNSGAKSLDGKSIEPGVSDGGDGNVGKHIEHLNLPMVSGLPANEKCKTCHNGYNTRTTHVNGVLDDPFGTSTMISFNTSLTGTVGSYDGSIDTCSGIGSCHGGGSPVWDENVSSLACTDCHSGSSAIDPLATGGEGSAGKHIPHASPAESNIACENCHEDYISDPNHGNGIYGRNETASILNFDADGTINYNGPNLPDGSPNVTVSSYNETDGTCSTISCHYNTGGVSWYAAGTVGCNTCHSSNELRTQLGLDSGNHLKHTDPAKSNTAKIADCNNCHFGYKDDITHMDGNTDVPTVNFGVNGTDTNLFNGYDVTESAWNSGAKECSNVACHQGTTALSWSGDTALTCRECHTTLPSSGSHTRHTSIYSQNDDCTICHNSYKSSDTHVDGTVNNPSSASGTMVNFDPAYNASGTYIDSTDTCSDLACHGNGVSGSTGSQTWGGASLGCDGCHANPPASGSHNRHVTVMSLSCEKCHDDGTDYSGNNHHEQASWTVNGTINTAFNGDANADFSVTTANTCTNVNCHGETLNASAQGTDITPEWGNVSTGACGTCHYTNSSLTQGSHSKHLTRYSNNCDKCHNDGVAAASHHTVMTVDGTLSTSFEGDTNADFNVSTANTCTNVNCHGENLNAFTQGTDITPEWGNAPTGACGTCHNTDSSLTQGSHTVHLTRYSNNCDKCHNDGVAQTDHHSAMTVDGTLSTSFEGDTNADFSVTTANTCTNVNCHGETLNASAQGTDITPEWGSAATGACGACHKTDSSMDQGSHQKHVNTHAMTCDRCHDDGDGNVGTDHHALGSWGVNGAVSTAFNGDANADFSVTTANTCTNVNCHGETLNASTQGTDITPEWGNVSTGACGTCHYTNSSLTQGSHTVHLTRYSNNCDKCHNDGVAQTDHHTAMTVDGTLSTSFEGDTNADFSVSTANTCTNVNCHGETLNASAQGTDITPEWGNVSTGACGTCHYTNSSLTQGSHSKHLTRYSNNCDKCHNDGVAQTDHHSVMTVDGALSTSFEGDTNADFSVSTANTCTNVNCHGETLNASAQGTDITPEWGNVSTGACGTCHNIDSTLTQGSHTVHLTRYSNNCDKCHNDGVAQTDHHSAMTVDGTLSTSFEGDTNADFSVTTANTCTNVNCHGESLNASAQGADITPEWGNAATGACGACHKTDSSMDQGSHQKHVNTHAMTCDRCHDDGDGNVGTDHHALGSWGVNGAVSVSFNASDGNAAYSAPACNNVDCHGENLNASTQGTDITPEWGSAATGACGTCHYTDSSLTQGSHSKHLTRYSNNCDKCHNDGVAQTDHHTAMIVDGTLLTSFEGDTNADFSVTTANTCTNVNCHGENLNASTQGTDITPEWGSAATGACGTCHYTNSSLAQGSHTVHLTRYSNNCDKCHNDGVAQTDHHNAMTVDGTLSTSFEGDTNADFSVTTANTCTNVNCHGETLNASAQGADITPEWGNAATGACGACHKTDSSMDQGSHQKHVNTHSMTCDRCHDDGDGNVGTDHHALGSWGVNGAVSTAFNGDANADFSVTTANTCTNVNCHGENLSASTQGADITPEWGNATTGACGTCHYTNSSLTQGSHTVHLSRYSNNCDKCHNDGVAQTDHHTAMTVDGTLSTSFDGDTNADFSVSTANTCTNVNCHGENLNASAQGTDITPEWGNVSTGACGTCHYTDSSLAQGSHMVHLVRYSNNCDKCHNDGVAQTDHHSALTVDGTLSTSFEGDTNADFSVTTANTCTNVNCHGENLNASTQGTDLTPEWGNAVTGACGTCHYTDSSLTQGSHSKHLTRYSNNCDKCHNDGVVQTDHHNAMIVDGTLSTSFEGDTNADFSVTTANTCTNVNCHGETLNASTQGTDITPEWGTPATGACGTCHYTDSSLIQGSHTVHLARYSNNCDKCHNDTVVQTEHHTALTVDGTLSTSFEGDTNADFSVTTANTCTNVNCHGENLNASAQGTDITPEWGSALTGACGTCHKTDSSMDQGSHSKHLNSPYSYNCDKCHNDNALTSEHHYPANMPVDNTLSVTFDSMNQNGSFVSGTKTCNDLYCHGNSTGGNDWGAIYGSASAQDNNPVWGSGTLACGRCHSIATGHNSPDPPYGSCSACHTPSGWIPPLITTGAHTKHVGNDAATGKYQIACFQCHSGSFSGQTTSLGSNHANGLLEVAADSTNNPSGVYTESSRTCSNFYCHGNFAGGKTANTGDWDGGTGGACGDCHDNAPLNSSFGAHDKHTDTGAGNYNFDCNVCHNSVASGQEGGVITLSSITNHANFTVDISFDSTTADMSGSTAAAWDEGTRTCTNTYCHGDFTGGLTSNTPDWDGGTGGACGNCHDNAPLNSAFGVHDRHTDTGAGNYNYECDVCHDGLVTGREGTAISLVSTANHVNFSVDVSFDATTADTSGSTAAAWDGGTRTCTNTYCHGDFTGGLTSNTPDWDGGTGGACGNCHDNAPLNTADGGRHDRHTDITASNGYNYNCDVCHDGIASGTEGGALAITSTSNHANFSVDVSFDASTADKSGSTAAAWDGTTKTCTNTYCHGDFAGGKTANTGDWDGGTGGACGDCHDNAPLNSAFGVHDKHTDTGAGNYNFNCNVCHNGLASGQEGGVITLSSIANHANFTVDISFDASTADTSGSTAAAWDGGTRTCTNTYCHGDFTGGLTSNTPDWDNGTGGACGNCHDNAPANTAFGSHDKHTNTSSASGYNFDCDACHDGIASGTEGGALSIVSTSSHVNFSANVSFDASTADKPGSTAAAWDGVTRTCTNTYCHGDFTGGLTSNTPDWDDGTGGACGNCHTISTQNATYGSHDKHTNVDPLGYDYDCSLCHSGIAGGKESGTPALDGFGVGHVNFSKNITFSGLADQGSNIASWSSGTKVCSNIYCHGDFSGGLNENPDWDASSGGACGGCHSVSDPGSGSHTRHVGGGANYSYNCTECHTIPSPNHANGTMNDNVSFSSNAKGIDGVGVYDKPTQTCTSVYCHGDFPGGKASNVPDWDGGTGGSCATSDCHDKAPANADYGNHDKHTNASSYNYDCSLCHSGIASGTESGSPLLSAITDHANFTKNVVFSGIADQGGVTVASWSSSTRECADTYCHGDMDGGLSSNTPDWDGGTGGACGDCHDNAPLNGTFGAHNKHTDVASGHNYECIQCHGTVTASGIREGSVFDDAAFGSGRYANHVDGNYTVAFSTTLADKTDTQGGTGATYDDAGNTCSDTYCHGDFDEGIANTPDWDGLTGGVCGNCHDNAPQNGTFGSHDSHTDSFASGKNYECSLCHAAVTASGIQEGSVFDDTAFGASRWTTHLNGSPDISFTGIADQAPDTKSNTAASYNSSQRQCSDTYCHGDFDEGIANTPDWDAGAGGACGDCHENAPQSVTFGVHDKHTNPNASNGKNYNCDQCHLTVTSGTSNETAGVSFGGARYSLHANGQPDVSFDSSLADKADTQGGTAAAYTTATKTCSDTYCHGDFDEGIANTPDWDSGTGGVCGNCHNNAPVNTDYGYHDKHTNTSGNSGHNYDCTYCHNTVTASGIKEGSAFNDAAFGSARWTNHANGSPNVTFTTTLADKTDTQGGSAASYNSGAKTCSNTYCHGDFDEGLINTPNWTHLSGSGGSCGDCHNNAPMNTDYGVHDKHTDTATYNYACQLCHNGSVAGAAVKEGIGSWSNTSELDATARWASHVNGSPTVNFAGQADQYTGTSASYTQGARVCNLTYCHGAFGSGATQWLEGNDGSSGKALNAPTWTTGSSAPCGSCHGDGANQALGVPTASNVWESSSESHAKHAGTNANSGYYYPCGFCHEGVYDATISTGDGAGGAYETGTKTPNYTQHADGTRTTLNFYSNFTTTGNANVNSLQDVTCTNLYCHSDGWDPANLSYEPSGAVTSPRWGGLSKSAITCRSCHNGSDNQSGADSSNLAPDEVDGTTFGPWPWYGTHHDPWNHEIACDHCHDNTTNSSGEGETDNSILYTANRHVNRYKNVKFDASEITITDDYVRNTTGGQCDITCHGRDHSYTRYKWYKNTDNKGTLIYE